MSQFRNLPGVNMDIQDGNMRLSDDNTTNSILIIGEVNAPESLEVPEGPIYVANEFELKEQYGNFFYKGTVNPIAQEWYIAKRSGIRNIYLLALKGETKKDKFIYLQDMLFNVAADLTIENVVLTGMYADEDVEDLTIEDFPEEMSGSKDLGSIDGIIGYYTGEASTDIAEVTIEEDSPETLELTIKDVKIVATVEKTLSGKPLVDHLNKEIKAALQAEGLEDEQVIYTLNKQKVVHKSTSEVTYTPGVIVTALGFGDLSLKLKGIGNPAGMLGHFAEMQSNQARSVIGYVAVKPVTTTNLVEIRDHVNALVERNNEFSRNIQVVAGPPTGAMLPGSNRVQWTTGVTEYACLVNRLAPQIATTNQTLPGVNQLRYNLSLRQMDRLVGNKYVVFQMKNNRISVVDGVTTAPDIFVGQEVVRSDFTRLSTLRTINYLSQRVYDEMDAFIGQPHDLEIYNAMNTAIKSIIKTSIENAIIQDATYSIQLGDSFDTSIINLSVLPQFELRKIDVSIGLSTPEGFTGGLANTI